MARPGKPGQGIYCRLLEEDVQELDEWLAELRQTDTIGARGATRSDLIRDIVEKATRKHREARGVQPTMAEPAAAGPAATSPAVPKGRGAKKQGAKR